MTQQQSQSGKGVVDALDRVFSRSAARRRSPGNGRLGRGLRRREKNDTPGGAGRFEKPAPDARAAPPAPPAPPEAHESLISRKTVAEVPLTGLSLTLAHIPLTGVSFTPIAGFGPEARPRRSPGVSRRHSRRDGRATAGTWA